MVLDGKEQEPRAAPGDEQEPRAASGDGSEPHAVHTEESQAVSREGPQVPELGEEAGEEVAAAASGTEEGTPSGMEEGTPSGTSEPRSEVVKHSGSYQENHHHRRAVLRYLAETQRPLF